MADAAKSTLATMGLDEAAGILRLAPSTLRKRAATGKVRGYKPGRHWIFLATEIEQYLKETASPCRSIAAPTLRTGGVVSRSRIEKSGCPLELELEAKLKNLKPRLALVRGAK